MASQYGAIDAAAVLGRYVDVRRFQIGFEAVQVQTECHIALKGTCAIFCLPVLLPWYILSISEED